MHEEKQKARIFRDIPHDRQTICPHCGERVFGDVCLRCRAKVTVYPDKRIILDVHGAADEVLMVSKSLQRQLRSEENTAKTAGKYTLYWFLSHPYWTSIGVFVAVILGLIPLFMVIP